MHSLPERSQVPWTHCEQGISLDPSGSFQILAMSYNTHWDQKLCGPLLILSSLCPLLCWCGPAIVPVCYYTFPVDTWAEAEDAFLKLKIALMEPPVLAYPEPDCLFILNTDASNTSVGAVLSQQLPENQEKVVAYYSRVLSASEHRYCVTRQELLAVVKAVKLFHVYPYDRKFLLVS